jgi:hypothetical protein
VTTSLTLHRKGAVGFIAWLDVAYLVSVLYQGFGWSVALRENELAISHQRNAYKPIVSFVFDIRREVASTSFAMDSRSVKISVPHVVSAVQANPAFAMLAVANHRETIKAVFTFEKRL